MSKQTFTAESITGRANHWAIALICSTIVGLAIFLPILFACTLPEAKTLRDTVELDCTYTALTNSSRYCCEHHWSTCGGCSRMGEMNGQCGAVMAFHDLNPHQIGQGNNTSTECCDGSCCAEHRTECDTCEERSCYTNSDGSQSCSTSYRQCNCHTYCVRHSSRKGTINCGTCHDFEAGFEFEIDGQVHKQVKHLACGLDDGSGLDDHHCQRETVEAHAEGERQVCWVNKETLEVSWEEPKWNPGCWVGIVIGALFLLPAVVGLVLLMAWFVRGWCRACAHVVDTTCDPCCSTAQAGCPPMGHGDADIEKSEGKQPTRSYPMQAGLTPLDSLSCVL